MQNLNLCKTHRFIELLVIRSPMHIYIRKENVEIFKLYQNCRNDVQFNSSLRKKGKKKVIFFFSVFRFTNKQIQKIEKRKSQEMIRVRRVNPHISPFPQIIAGKLFLVTTITYLLICNPNQ